MIFNEPIIEYAEQHTSDESPVLRELREFCYREMGDSSPMLSGFVQGRILAMFSRMIKPSVVLEIGTYLGYSALCFAEGLAEDGKVITIDVQEDTNKIAKSYVARTEYANQIEFLLGPATELIPTLTETFDLVFIDADKPNYSNYFDITIERVRPGGFIIADNVLWSGQVLDKIKDENTQALADFNEKILADDRVDNVLLPIRDGLMVMRKKEGHRTTVDDDIPIYDLVV